MFLAADGKEISLWNDVMKPENTCFPHFYAINRTLTSSELSLSRFLSQLQGKCRSYMATRRAVRGKTLWQPSSVPAGVHHARNMM